MNEILLKLENICFSYRPPHILFDNLNLSVYENQSLCITGENGCGKTTLCKIIMGLLTPSKGKIIFDQKECSSEKDFTELRRKVGFVFQNSEDQLFCPTVAEDVAFGPFNLGKKRCEVEEIVQNTLEILGISHLASRNVWELSTGEKKIVAIAGVLAMSPKIILLDEPDANLSSTMRYRLLEILETLDMVKIVISHNETFISRIKNAKIMELKAGRIR